MSPICPRYVPEISQIFSRYFQNMFRICFKHFPDNSQFFSPNMSQLCPEYVLYISQICLLHRERWDDWGVFKGQSKPGVSPALRPTDQTTTQIKSLSRFFQSMAWLREIWSLAITAVFVEQPGSANKQFIPQPYQKTIWKIIFHNLQPSSYCLCKNGKKKKKIIVIFWKCIWQN